MLCALTHIVPAQEATREPIVTHDAGGYSIDARGARLDVVLAELAAEADLTLELAESLPQSVTIALENKTLAGLIERLLRGRAYLLLIDSSATPASGTASRLRVFASGNAAARIDLTGNDTDADGRDPRKRIRKLDVDAGTIEQASVAELATGLGDRSRAVRLESTHGLGQTDDARSISLLEIALVDPDARVRAEAVSALGDLGGEHSARALAGALAHPDPALRESAVYTLGEIGGTTALGLLQTATDDPDELVREAAEEILEGIDDD